MTAGTEFAKGEQSRECAHAIQCPKTSLVNRSFSELTTILVMISQMNDVGHIQSA